MRVVGHAAAQDFLAASAGFRAADPVLTNVIGSVAGWVRDGRRDDSELWLTIHDRRGSEPVGIAMRTAPHNLVVARRRLARQLRDRGRPECATQPGLGAGRAGVRASADTVAVGAGGGQPVSLAGHAPLVPTPAGTVGRVGPVYTPEQHRGRGYGSAITHAVSESLRQRCGIVMLCTDAANAASNAVYERLGYAVVAEVVEIQVEPRGGGITGQR